jgi:hypothetical protein
MWYENHLHEDEEPYWFNDWKAFKQLLEYHFGEANAEHTAERRIRELHMKTNDTVISYITKFHTVCNNLKWNDAAITAEFRRGLSSRLKDDLAKVEYEHLDLMGLQALVIKLDDRYQERQTERATDRPEGRRDMNIRTATRIEPRATSTSVARRNPPTLRPFGNGTPPVKPLPLDTDGHVNTNEKQRRANLGLCAYCGEKHHIEDCTKKPNLRSSYASFSVQGFQEGI